MRKKVVQMLTLALIICFLPQFVFAGGVDNKQNWSAAYAASPTRNAAIEGADIAAYNPAGIMQLENGLTCALDTQFISINYDHSIDGKDYGIDGLPVVPSLFAIYKMDKVAFFGSFTIPGGGGEVEYDDGNIITKKIANGMVAQATASPFVDSAAFSDEYAYVESLDYCFTAGASYAVNDALSFSAGLRRVITDKEVDIHGTFSKTYNPLVPGVGGTTDSENIVGKYDQEADGYGGVFGVNYRPNETYNFALRYETRVNLDWDTSIPSETKGTTGETLLNQYGRVDGESYARDLPAVLALGMEWSATEKLTIKPSFTYYFEKDADWDTQNDAVDHNSYDMALGLAYQVNEKWEASTGYMYTENGVDPDNYGIIEQMSPPLDAHSLSLGGKYNYNDRLAFGLGAMGIFYESETAEATELAPGAELAPETKYSKTNYVVGLSVEYRFF